MYRRMIDRLRNISRKGADCAKLLSDLLDRV
jgi:hypothetical protein